MPEDKRFTLFQLIGFFESKLASLTGKSTVDGYGKALLSFRNFVGSRQSTEESVTQSFLEDWYVAMRFKGLTAKTASYYFDNIASLNNAVIRHSTASQSDIFRNVKSKIKESDSGIKPFLISDDDYDRFLALLTRQMAADERMIRDIIFFSAVNSGWSLREIALLKKNDIDRLPGYCRRVAERYIEPKRKYVFPLRQSFLTPGQLEAYLSGRILRFFNDNSLPVFGGANETIKMYRAYTALKSGIAPSTVASISGQNLSGMSLLGMCTARDGELLSAEDVDRVVADALCDDTLRWYAMRLRPRVSYDDIVRRFKDSDAKIRCPEMFYPCEEIAKRVGKKLVWKEKPIISNIVFFKSRLAEIYPMFLMLYDLAWCYRGGRNRSGAYSVISDMAMRQFQETIGKFTPEYEITPLGHIELSPDEHVVVIGGDYAGRTGTYLGSDIDVSETGRIVYRILLPGNNGTWNVGVDARLVRRVEDCRQ